MSPAVSLPQRAEDGKVSIKMNPGSEYMITEKCVAGVCIAARDPATAVHEPKTMVLISQVDGRHPAQRDDMQG